MKLDQQQLEWIVREVVRRLEARAGAAGAEAAEPANCRELTLCDRVVTTNTLEGRIAGVKQVRVDPRAIVTPAARDLLTEHCVTLMRGEALEMAAPRPVGMRSPSARQNCSQCWRH